MTLIDGHGWDCTIGLLSADLLQVISILSLVNLVDNDGSFVTKSTIGYRWCTENDVFRWIFPLRLLRLLVVVQSILLVLCPSRRVVGSNRVDRTAIQSSAHHIRRELLATDLMKRGVIQAERVRLVIGAIGLVIVAWNDIKIVGGLWIVQSKESIHSEQRQKE